MPGGGRRWKTLVSRHGEAEARHRVFHRRPPPLEIAHGAISTFPQRQRFFPSQNQNKTARALRALAQPHSRKEDSPPAPSREIAKFQAHLALESKSDFRLI